VVNVPGGLQRDLEQKSCFGKGEGVVPRVLDSCGISVIGDIEDLGRAEGIYGSYRREKSRRAERTTVSVLALVASGNI
jgi:hypothetical protein